jgi:hypothetical protein
MDVGKQIARLSTFEVWTELFRDARQGGLRECMKLVFIFGRCKWEGFLLVCYFCGRKS